MSARADTVLGHLTGGTLLCGAFRNTTLPDEGPGCVACTIEMGFLQFGACKAKVQLSARPGSCEGPLTGLQLAVFSLCLQWEGTGRSGQGWG